MLTALQSLRRRQQKGSKKPSLITSVIADFINMIRFTRRPISGLESANGRSEFLASILSAREIGWRGSWKDEIKQFDCSFTCSTKNDERQTDRQIDDIKSNLHFLAHYMVFFEDVESINSALYPASTLSNYCIFYLPFV
jgi:hypothetical protein